uniref:Transposase n=1 Tax=Echinococcus granulosus TaxID=6210 RepID=A0A068WJ71_ECHGR|nr:hypothetical protein EgrG_000511000 [Echinococcus granulosus]
MELHLLFDGYGECVQAINVQRGSRTPAQSRACRLLT